MCFCEMYIQDGIYKDYLNGWHKRRLRFLNKHGKKFMSGTHSQQNSKNNALSYSNAVLPYGEHINPRSKYGAFETMCDFPGKNIQFSKVVKCFKLLQVIYSCFCY